jgi:hypothetical protein
MLPGVRRCVIVAGDGDDEVRRGQQEWRRVRSELIRGRYELSRAAQELYPRAARVAGTPLLTRPRWQPDAPVPLEQVSLSWQPGWPARIVDGTGPESAAVRPLRGDGTRFPGYAEALGALSRPALLENRACYRLTDMAVSPAGAHLGFGEGRYFEGLDVGEAAAHEFAAAALARTGTGDPGGAPPLAGLPLRSRIGDPTDLRRRPVMAAICTLVLRADRTSGQARMILHWRDPDRVASNGGLYQVAPVGVFQPSHDADWNRANDFSLWRGMVRELAEELLGADEDYHSDAAPIDYERWPLYATLSQARQAGSLRVFWLGLGIDPLNLACDMLTVAVFDAGLFDATFAGLVAANDEGRLVTGPGAAGPAAGAAFRHKEVERFTRDEPMQAAGAALLRTAWQHRAVLLG